MAQPPPTPPAYQRPYTPVPQYPSPAQPTGNKQLLYLIALALCIALVVLFVIWMLIGRTPIPIDFSIRAEATQVKQGAPLTILQSLGPSSEQTLINYAVEDVVSKEIVLEQQEHIPLGAPAPSSKELTIPADLKPGRYVLNAQVQRDGKTARSSFVFQVARKEQPKPRPVIAPPVITPPISTAPLETPVCSTACNDYDACTVDRCVAGECRFDTFTPCCGNNQCEPGEDTLGCPLDCAEKGTQKPEAIATITDRAIASAKTNPGQAADLCQSLSVVDDINSCFAEVAKAAAAYPLCLRITAPTPKDTCLIDLAVEHDSFEACDHIEDRWLQNSCYSYANLKKLES